MPIFAALLPQLLSMIPGLISLFGKGSAQSTINAKAAEVVTGAITEAAGAVNLQQAVEKMAADKALQADVAAKVMASPTVSALVEVGGGIAAARVEARAIMESPNWWKALLSPAFLMSMMLMPLVYYTVYRVYTSVGETAFSPEIKASVVSAIISGVLFAVVGYFLGSSASSAKKDDALAQRG
jgi:hypothetical protein